MFVVAAAAIGFGPEEWIKWLLTDATQFFTPSLVRWALIILGGLTFLAIVGPIFRDINILRFGRVSKSNSDLQLIYLPESPWIEVLKDEAGRKLGRIHRIKVKNRSDNTTLHKVRLSIPEIAEWHHAFPNAALSALGGEAIFDLHPGAEQFVNLFRSADKRDEVHLTILYDNETIPNMLPRKDKKIRIQAQSESTPSVNMWVSTGTTPAGKLTVTPMGN